MSALEEWLHRTKAVEVLQDDLGPYATTGSAVPDWHHTVWVSNGDTDPRAWVGTLIARCRSHADAELVAEALRRMQTSRP